MNVRKGSRIRALVALAAVVIVLEVQPAEALAPGLPPLARSSKVRSVAPIPTSWFTTAAAYVPSATWRFACPWTDVVVG